MSEAEDAARTVARAFARSAIYYRKTALIAGFIALGACISGVVLEATPSRVVVLAFAILFAIFTYRSMRAMRRYLDPKHSPVLDALAMSPVRHHRRAMNPRPSTPRICRRLMRPPSTRPISRQMMHPQRRHHRMISPLVWT